MNLLTIISTFLAAAARKRLQALPKFDGDDPSRSMIAAAEANGGKGSKSGKSGRVDRPAPGHVTVASVEAPGAV